MKIHITNIYCVGSQNTLIERQHQYTNAGLLLGFREMGIYLYPTETDSSSELSKRLDGVIASLESGDIVFLQLPTGNGEKYERQLALKIKAYPDTRIVVILHAEARIADSDQSLVDHYLTLCRLADAVVIENARDKAFLQNSNVLHLVQRKTYEKENGQTDEAKDHFGLKKAMMDALEILYEETEKRQCQAENAEVIQIAFALYDKNGDYSKWVGTAMLSIIEHTGSRIHFHILHDRTLTTENRRKLIQVGNLGENQISFHDMSEYDFSDFEKTVRFYTIGSLFRTLIPEVMEELDKVLYLDADIYVNSDIKELWKINVEDHYLAAVADEGISNGTMLSVAVTSGEALAERYFNSGVLLMNLRMIRRKGCMYQKIFEYIRRVPETNLPDQDALNVVYGDKVLLLDKRWNYFALTAHRRGEKALINGIYHYAGCYCELYSLAEYDLQYYETLCRTPWGMQDGPECLMRNMSRIVDRTNLLEKLVQIISNGNKKRIYYGEETYAMKNIYHILPPREGDYRIMVHKIDKAYDVLSCQDFAILQHEKDDFIVMVLPEADQWSAIGRLETMGLKNEQDFFVIPRLLTPEKGGFI